jgi:hypothetical protein
MRPGVYVTETTLASPVTAGSPSAAAGALIAPLPSGPTTPTLVTSWYQFNRLFGNLNTAYKATFQANMFFSAGGRDLYVCRVVKGDAAAAQVTLLAADGTTHWAGFTAKSKGSYGNTLRISISKNAANLYDISVIQELTSSSGLVTDTVLETFYDLDLATYGNQTIVDVFAIRSQFINFAWDPAGSAATVASSFSTLALISGSDGTSGSSYDYDTPLENLAQIDRTLVLFIPGNTNSTNVSSVISFAEANGGFAVLDTASGLLPAAAVSYAASLTASDHAAVYYPRVWVADPTSRSRDAVTLVAPSGAVVGAYLSTDASAGVFKAPAGLSAVVPNVVALERTLTAADLDTLNSDSTPVNALRVAAGVGTVIMGARTLNQTRATRYVNIRRSMLYLEHELKNRLQFAVFENNNSALWGRMRTAANVMLQSFWAAGGLRGTTQAQAFYVKIDNENNSPSDIANGIVNVEVGVALQYPAEFIKINLTQQTLA